MIRQLNRPSLRYLTLFLLLLQLAISASAQSFKAPDYDVRLALDTTLLNRAFQSLDGTEYGDTIRLRDFKCGEPSFKAILKHPNLTVSGLQNTARGEYEARFGIQGVLDAKLGDGCLGVKRALIRINAGGKAGRLSQMADVTLDVDLYLSTFGENPFNLLTWPFGGVPFSSIIPLHLPIKAMSALPIVLSDSPEAQLDFGATCGKPCNRWTSLGQHKDIPIDINLGSFANSDGSRQYLVADATFGTPRRRTVGSDAEARSALEEDLPIWGGRNIGVSIKPSTFSNAQACPSATDVLNTLPPCSPGVGLLAALLPIRLRGEKKLTDSLTVQYALILDGASVNEVTNGGDTALQITLSTGEALMRLLRTNGGSRVPVVVIQGPPARAHIKLDRLQIQNGEFQFRVSEFRAELQLPVNWPVPNPGVWLSAGDLERQLNGGRIPLAPGLKRSVLTLPECIPVHEKFKSRFGDCSSPSQRADYLSRDLSQNHHNNGGILDFDPSSVDLRTQPWLMLSGSVGLQPAPNLPEKPLSQLLNGEPLLVTRWLFADSKNGGASGQDQGEAQCWFPGGFLYTKVGDWTDRIRMDTDNRFGGCLLSFGIIDPAAATSAAALPDPGLSIEWAAAKNADRGQCGTTWRGKKVKVPVTRGIPADESALKLSSVMFVNTDGYKQPGCEETFFLEATSKYELDVQFWGDDDPSQCAPPNPHPEPGGFWTVRPGKSLTFGIDSDIRYGGCDQILRLRRVK